MLYCTIYFSLVQLCFCLIKLCVFICLYHHQMCVEFMYCIAFLTLWLLKLALGEFKIKSKSKVQMSIVRYAPVHIRTHYTTTPPSLIIFFFINRRCNPCGFWPAQLSLSILSRKVFTECCCQQHVKPPTWRTSD